jgi:hypothetical protein
VKFRPFSADSYGKTKSIIFSNFFSSACNFGQNANRPKILVGQIRKYTQKLPQKTFHVSQTNIGEFIWGPLVEKETQVSSLQIPISISFKSAQGA